MIKLSNQQYNFLKWFITIFLPAVGGLYFGLAQIFDFSRIPGVNGTINLIIVFLGVVTGVATKNYNKEQAQNSAGTDGDLLVVEDPEDGTKYLKLVVEDSVEAMAAKPQVTLNVVKPAALTGEQPQS